ncbi:MAG TPA: HNH endonuclease, partial [Methylomirabilota bacterium]|nr:HNH endonuclease [Methylomirabilota bacterium]
AREHIPRAVRQRIYTRDGFACRYCGRKRGHAVRLELDHFYPVSRGGNDDPDNLVTACFDCNRAKGARLLRDDDAVRRFVTEREAAISAMTRADWRRVLRRDLLLTAFVALVVTATFLALTRYVF